MADVDVMPPAPVGAPEEEELRKQRLLGIAGTPLNKPAPVMPPVSQPQPATTTNQPASAFTMPPAKAPTADRSSAIQPGQTMPAAPIGPAEQRLAEHEAKERPHLTGWKKVLDVIGSLHPIGRAIEQQIPGNPHQFDAEGNRLAFEAAREQKGEQGRQTLEAGASQSRFNTPEKRRAYMEQNPEVFEDVSDFQKNDWVLAGKFPQHEPAEKKENDKKIDEYTTEDGKRALTFQRADGTIYDRIGGKVFEKPQADANKLAGEIEAQVGPKPTTAEYGGKKYPSVEAAQRAWGQAAEAVKNREAQAGRSVLNEGKAVNVIRKDEKGNSQLLAIHPDKLQPGDVLAGAGAGMQTMSKDAQFAEIHSGIDNLRNAIKNLDKPFSPAQIGKLTLAMKHSADPTVFRTELETIIGTQELTPAQEDLVIWMGHLNERALSLRNIAGMGQGSDQMRSAIQAILPGVKSGSVEMMNKQLAAFENQVDKLEKGVPKMPGEKKEETKGGFTPF